MILVWLVQLVIYPAFLYFPNRVFRRWHTVYTQRVTYVVLPVMLGQLGLYCWLTLAHPSWDIVLNLVLTLAVWGTTFFRAVPLHGALDQAEDHLPLSTKLVALNWWRTGLWTTIWVVSILACFDAW
ncbi:hypothetical protein [Neolewinella persica]|uniref:hypothetical protein n=1 Tax=Neolewinella persica TaxID=70998 RepID=UPI0012FBCDA5|nr:hypothetical protein [Neolewinella persica]